MKTPVNSGKVWQYTIFDEASTNQGAKFYGISVGSSPLIIRETTITTASNSFYIAFYEDESWTGGSVTDKIFNHDRVNPKTREFTVSELVVPDTAPPPINKRIIISELNNQANNIITNNDDGKFWQLNPNTSYILEFFNNENNTSIFTFQVNLEERGD